MYRCEQSTSLAFAIYLICAAGQAYVRQQWLLQQQTPTSIGRRRHSVAAPAEQQPISHLFSDELAHRSAHSRRERFVRLSALVGAVDRGSRIEAALRIVCNT